MNTTVTDKTNEAFVVHRSLHVPDMQNSEKTLRNALFFLPGMQAVTIDLNHDRLKLTYNTAQTSFSDIEKALMAVGHPPSARWWSRCKASWYRYLDENAQANAKSKGGACCSNPSDIYANRRK